MQKLKDIKLIIGLGNPEKEYESTYHNVGHFFIDSLQKFEIRNLKLEIIKSNVFMNKSGEFVKKILKNSKTNPEHLLIAHDDSDIELGKVKLSFGRGSAGHKGVQDIINRLKTKNFWRLRIGIRPIEKTRAKAGEFVLKKIPAVNKKILQDIFVKEFQKLIF